MRWIALFSILLVAGLSFSATNVSTCQLISTPGEYVMNTSLTGQNIPFIGWSGCIAINTSNVSFDCAGHSITADNASNSFGIYADDSVFGSWLENITIKNCPAISGYEQAVVLIEVNRSSLANVTVFGNTGLNTSGDYGAIEVEFSQLTNFSNIVARDTTIKSGFKCLFCYDSNFRNITAYNNAEQGAVLGGIFYGNLDNISTYSNGANGSLIYLMALSNTSGLRSYGNAENGLWGALIFNSSFLNTNTSSNAQSGAVLTNMTYSVYDFISSNNSGHGLIVNNTNYSNFTDGAISDNLLDGLRMESSVYNNILRINSTNNKVSGFYAWNSYNNTFSNNNASGNNYGYWLLDSSYNNVTSSAISSNYLFGMLFSGTPGGGSKFNNVFGNIIRDNANGVFIWSYYASLFAGPMSNNNVLSGNLIHGNAGSGVASQHSIFTMTYDRLYNNGVDLNLSAPVQVGAGPFGVLIANVVFDNPAGTLQNFTNLTIGDFVEVGSAYGIKWAAPSALPSSQYKAFHGFLNITNYSSFSMIDAIQWRWHNGELSGFRESEFILWKNNGTWNQVPNQTLNTSGNSITVYNMTAFSDFVILQNDSCPVITSPGVYSMGTNYTGAPNSVNMPAYPTLANACVIIESSNVTFDCAGYSLTHNGSDDTVGVLVNISRTNVTVKNCRVNAYENGILSPLSNDSHFLNNTVFNSTMVGIIVREGYRNQVDGNTVHGSSLSGFRFLDLYDSNLTGNLAYDNAGEGFYFYDSGNLLLESNSAQNNSDDGFMLTSENIGNTIRNCTAYNNSGDGFYVSGDTRFGLYSSYNLITNNTAWENSLSGFRLVGNAYNNSITDCTAHHNDQDGFAMQYNRGNNLTSSTSRNNLWNGFYLDGALSSVLDINLAEYNGAAGYYIAYDSDGNNLTANNATYNNQSGFVVDSSSYNRLLGNRAYQNNGSGISTFLSGGWVNDAHNVFTGNLVYINDYGVFLGPSSFNTSLSGNAVYNNRITELQILDTYNATITDDAYSGSANDITVEGMMGGGSYRILYAQLGEPGGSVVNRTNLTMFDVVSTSDNYTVNWTQRTDTPTENHYSFRNKTVNISDRSSSVIDYVAFSWTPSEAAGYNESLLQLWKYNSSGWTLQNNSPSPAGRNLSLTSMDPSSDYSIFEYLENCPIINVSGTTYAQTRNFVGAPNSAFPPVGGSACVKIMASNVVYDCNGYNITDNGTAGDHYGILLNLSATNVTLRNCMVSGYSVGVVLIDASRNNVTNITSFDNALSGIMLTGQTTGSHNNSFSNNNLYNNGNYGFQVVFSSSNNTFRNNTALNHTQYGFFLGTNCNGNSIVNNTANNNSAGFALLSAFSNNLTNNIANSNQQYGIYLLSAGNNRIVGNNATSAIANAQGIYLTGNSNGNVLDWNNASGNSLTGIQVAQYSTDNNITNNHLNSNANGYGLFVNVSDNQRIINNTAGGNVHGIYALGSANCLISDNIAGANAQSGIYLELSNGTSISNNNASGNTQNGILLIQAAFNNLTSNLLTLNGNYGIYLAASPNNRVEGNNASSNGHGIRLDGVSHNNLVDSNTAWSNTGYGIVLSIAQQNNITRNNVSFNNDGIYLSAPSNRVIGNNFSNNSIGIHVTGGSSTNNLVADNFANGNVNYGIFVAASDNNHNNLTNNTASQNFHGIWVQDSEYCILRNNFAGNNTNNGYYVGTAAHNTLLHNNTAGDNGGYGFYLISSDICTMADNTAFGNSDGIDAESATSLTFLGNVVHDNLGFGMRVWSVTDSMLNNNTAYSNPRSGIVVRESGGIDVHDNLAYDNDEAGIFLERSDTNSILRNNASVNGLAGIFLNMSDGNTIEDNLADGNAFLAIGMDNSTLNGIARCNASNSLYGFIFINSPSNTLSDSIGHDFTDLGDGGGNPDLTTGGRAVSVSYASNGNLIQNNLFHTATIFGVNVADSNGTVLRNNTANDCFVGFGFRDSDSSTLEENRLSNNMAGAVFDTASSSVVARNNITDNLLLGMLLEDTWFTNTSMNLIGGSMMGLVHQDSGFNTMEDDHFFNNSDADFGLEMAIDTPGIPLNLSNVIFDSPGGNFENYTVLSLDDTLGVETYLIKWTDNASSLPLPANTFSFAQKFITINDTTGNASIDRLTWHWLQAEVVSPFDEGWFQLWEFSGAWAFTDAALSIGANTLTMSNASGFGDFAILQYVPPEGEDEPSEEEADLDVRIIPACQGFIVEVKNEGSPVPNAFVKIIDQTADTELAPRYTNESGQAFVSICDIDVSVKASKSGLSGHESGFAECGFCPECATDDDCALTEQCAGQLCVPIDCPDGQVVDHACERFECVRDSDCKNNQSCVNHRCITVYECDYGLANTTEDDHDGCDDNEYCDVPVGAPGGYCKPILGCGEIANHMLIPWECGDAEGCPSCAPNELCIGHSCVQGDLSCPPSGLVGDNKTCQAREDGQPCISCDYEITMPDGRKLAGKTDQGGNLLLPLNLEGTYRIALLKDNQTIKVLSVKALPKSTPAEDQAPASGGLELVAAGLLLLILAAFAFGAFLYWKRRKGQKRQKK